MNKNSKSETFKNNESLEVYDRSKHLQWGEPIWDVKDLLKKDGTNIKNNNR